MSKWDHRSLALAKLVASWSKDPSTKCGAVITRGKRIVSVGFNGLPENIKDEERFLANRLIKLKCILHAEENAITFSKSDLTGCSIYTWPFQPCSHCASLIIQSGIKCVTFPPAMPAQYFRWAEEFQLAEDLFIDAGVSFRTLSSLEETNETG